MSNLKIGVTVIHDMPLMLRVILSVEERSVAILFLKK